MSPGTPATAWHSRRLLPPLGQTERQWWAPQAPFGGGTAPLARLAQHVPAQEGSRRSPFLKDRRGLRLALLPAVSTPSGRDLPSFSFDFWVNREESQCGDIQGCPFPGPRLLVHPQPNTGFAPSSGKGTQHLFLRPRDRSPCPPCHPAHLAEVRWGAAAAGVGPQVGQGLPLALCPQAGLVERGFHKARVAVKLHQVKDLRREDACA